MQEGAALAVRGAPESGRAVLAARQQALPVGAQAEPVDAPAVVRADPQGRPSAPHPAGRAADLGGGCAPLGRGARVSSPRLPVAASRGHRGAPGPRLLRKHAARVKRRTLAPVRPPGLPARGGGGGCAALGGPLGTPGPRVQQSQPHRRGTPPLPAPPGKTRTPPEQRRPGARGKARTSSRGAGDGENTGSGAPAYAPRPAPRAPGGRGEQYSSAWLLLRDHPSTCPSHFPGLRSRPRPRPRPRPLGTDLSPRSPRPPLGRCGPLGVRRFRLPGLRLWAPAPCHPRQDQRPGRGGGEGGGLQGLGWGDAHAGNSPGPAAARHHQASQLLPGSQS